MQELPGALLLFFITALISSYGSLQLGPVNGGVLRYCFRGEFRRAIWLALGGSLTEIPYASVAVWGSSWLNKMQGLESWINYAIIPLFLLLGIRFLLSAKKELAITETGLPEKSRKNPFREGIALAMFNPQLPLFWISILLWMKSGLGIYPDGLLKQAAFVLGTAAGAFYLLWLIIRISIKKRSRLSELSRRYQPEKLLGWFFILMALVQLVRVILVGNGQ
jgi:threonine/homoserine/homoserine lactone efflux protein